MSLWSKRIGDITNDDIQDFCLAKNAEGLRIEYKSQPVASINKSIAALANTLGGLIVCGVMTDKKAGNQPVWPACGFTPSKAFSEQILQICTESIYPPTLVEISDLIPNTANAGTFLAVIRVPESPESPHAIDSRSKIYVRTGDLNDPISLADIDAIEHLLGRRTAIVQKREQILQRAMLRSKNTMQGLPRSVWTSISPLYPWRQLCEPSVCHDLHKTWYPFNGLLQRIPSGSMGLSRGRVKHYSTDIDTGELLVSEHDERVGFSTITSDGHVFAFQRLFVEQDIEVIDFWKPFVSSKRTVDAALSFYRDNRVQKTGFVEVTVGFEDVRGCGMAAYSVNYSGGPFIDDNMVVSRTVPLEELLTCPKACIEGIFTEIAYGFDLTAPTSWPHHV